MDKTASATRKEEKKVDPIADRILVLNCEMNENITEMIKNIIEASIKEKRGNIDEVNLISLTKNIYKKMEKTHGKGWNVFVGAFFSGLCTYEENHYVELQFGRNRAVVFKVHTPKKN